MLHIRVWRISIFLTCFRRFPDFFLFLPTIVPLFSDCLLTKAFCCSYSGASEGEGESSDGASDLSIDDAANEEDDKDATEKDVALEGVAENDGASEGEDEDSNDTGACSLLVRLGAKWG